MIKKTEKKGKMLRRNLNLWMHSDAARCTALALVATLLLCIMFFIAATPVKYTLSVGSISRYTIIATKDVVDEVTTASRRQAAADAVEPTYHLEEGASEAVLANLETVFSELRVVQQYGLTLRKEGDNTATLRLRNFSESEIGYAKNLISHVTLTNYQISTLLRSDTSSFEDMVSSVTTAVSNTLNTTIREGQVNQSITAILQIVGYKVETGLYQNIVPQVLRTCIKPNMVIEQEATELARRKAYDSVEPVVYLQGQNIVREGERITANQMAMLRTLGLLNNGKIDMTTYYGSAIMVFAAMAMLFLLLRVNCPATLKDLRRLSVLLIVLVVSIGISVPMVMFVTPYLVPVALSAILATTLLGMREGMSMLLPAAFLTGALVLGNGSTSNAETIHLMMSGVCSGLISVVFLHNKPQRIRMVFCGFIISAVNVLVGIAVNIMVAADATILHENLMFLAVVGIIDGLLALGIQALIETIFNLATPSKLMELANPNQPLLRRLLLEASGTYHHSIIVANLAEAAAEKIGANASLARTGAYYHDVGKLKRPLYFKENQMGDNPHDRTDPLVSAAILTSHPKDGIALAQKARMPKAILDIIEQHHGDTPVVYFYDRALKQYGPESTHIEDFRYAGPKPQSAEAAIVMLADSIEAAARSMQEPTPDKMNALIHKLVRAKMDDGQLDESPLTMRDLERICAAFMTVLHGVFHERVEYPTVNITRVPGIEAGAPETPQVAVQAAPQPAAQTQEEAKNAGV